MTEVFRRFVARFCILATTVVLTSSVVGSVSGETVVDNLKAGFTALDEERFGDAEAAYRRALGMARGAEQTSHAALGLGSALMALGRPVEAVEAFSLADRSQPGRTDTLRLLAGAFLAAGDPSSAASVLERVIRISPEPRDFQELGVLHSAEERHEDAARVFGAGALRFPDDSGMRVGLAVAFYHQGLLERALAVFDAVLERDPASPQAVFGRAMTLLAVDDPDAAAAELGRLRELDEALARELARQLAEAR